MGTTQETVDYILDQLGAGVTERKMFGEYALYAGGKVVALVCDDTLFVKITEAGRKFVGNNYEEGNPYPGSKPWMRIDADLIEQREWLSELIDITSDHAPAPKPKKKKIH